ncbi:MAG: hypothetical protein HC802_08495, partial [Caldilineaceae bacterium]|nr:hypothetical protein [Caldilineaceae bacterium]
MRILIASADRALRLALLLLLESEPGLVVIGISDQLSNLLTVVDVSHTDIVVLDCEFSGLALDALID